MSRLTGWHKKYLWWFWKHKIITVLFVLIVLFVKAVTSGGGYNQNAADNQTTSTDSSQQQNTSQSAAPAPSTSSTSSSPSQAAPAKPALRQDLAFQGDASYCDGIYKDNGNGTTTWSYDIKQPGELITHLSDNNGHTYRHDVQITDTPNYYSYTAPAAIKDVAEIDGVLTAGSDGTSYPCNLSPQQQPQQAY